MRTLVVATDIALLGRHGGSTRVRELVDHLGRHGATLVLARRGSSEVGTEVLANHIRWTYEPRPDLRHWTIFRTLKAAALTWALGPWLSL